MSRKQIKLYVDSTKNPRNSLVRSITNGTPSQIPDAIFGDTLDLSVQFVAGGSLDVDLNATNISLTSAVGQYGSSNLAFTSNFQASSSYGFTGSLNLATNELSGSLGTSRYINAVFAITAFDSNTGFYKTYLSTPIVVWNSVFTGSITPAEAPSYYTISESNARFVTFTELANSTASVQAGNGIVKVVPNIIHAVTDKSYTPLGGLVYANTANTLTMSNAMKFADTVIALSASRVAITGSTFTSGSLTVQQTASINYLTASRLFVTNPFTASYSLESAKSYRLDGDIWYNSTGSAMIQRVDDQIQYGIHASKGTSSFFNLVEIEGNTSTSASNPSLVFGNRYGSESGIGFSHNKNSEAEFVLKLGLNPTGSIKGRLDCEVPANFRELSSSKAMISQFTGSSKFQQISINGNPTGSALLSILGGSAGQPPIAIQTQTSDVSTAVAPIGSLWCDAFTGMYKMLWGYGAGQGGYIPLTLFRQTSIVTITGATPGDQSIVSGFGYLTLPANVLSTNHQMNFKLFGYSTMVSTGRTVNFKFKIGGTTIVGTGAIDAQNQTNMLLVFEGSIIVQSIGASGAVRAQGYLMQAHSDINKTNPAVGTSNVSIDTTISNAIAVTCEIVGGGGTDTVIFTGGYINIT